MISAPAALIAALGIVPQAAYPLGLGSATTSSRVDGPIRVEIPIQSGEAESVDLQCLSLASQPVSRSDDLPWLTKARLSLETRDGKPLLVISAPGTSQPVIMLGVLVNCGTALRRDYTLLLEPPLLHTPRDTPPPVAQAPLPISPSPAPAITPKREAAPEQSGRITVLEGDSARSIANRLYPADVSAQRRMARAILSANAISLGRPRPGTLDRLPAGLDLTIPALPPAVQSTVSDAPDRPVTEQAAAREKRAPSLQAAARDRLIVSGGADDSGLKLSGSLATRRELSEPQRDRLRTEMQLLAALDEKIATQLELAERLRQLEALQTHLRADADRLEQELKASQSRVPATPASAPVTLQATPAKAPPPEASSLFAQFQNWLLAMAGILIALILAGILVWRRMRSRSDQDAEIGQPLPSGPDASLIEPLSEADIWPDEQGQAPRALPKVAASLEGALSSLSPSGFGPPSVLQIVEGDVEEHDSAVELAEIMMSFGRVQGAAQTLADFIRVNPKQAVKPWIKLLEVYRAADMRTEYEALCSRLNKTFNVRPAAWDEFELARQAPDSLEGLPHIVDRLTGCWGRRECQAFLHTLLRDNRQGTRTGFPLAIIDEILLLLGILERQLGPYRPDMTEPAKPEPSTRAVSRPVLIPTTELAVPPIIDEDILAMSVVINQEKPESSNFRPYESNQLDFDLDMTDLSKTLHIDLDQIGATDKEDEPPR